MAAKKRFCVLYNPLASTGAGEEKAHRITEILGSDTEIEYLPWGAKLMTLECGIRFLTDYLVGDTYFRIHREGHNLDRCRTQFKLVADMEEHWDEMCAIANKFRKNK